MASRPLKLPGHRPLTHPEDRVRPFSGAAQRRSDPKLGPLARCLSRGPRRPGGGGFAQPPSRALVDAVAAREASIRRLRRLAEDHAEGRVTETEARRELVDALLHCRALSLEVCEAFENWRASSNRGGPLTDPQYIVRMKDDTRWLSESTLGEFLNFSFKTDPFFVVPSSRETAATPANQMTPKLQARRQQLGERHWAVLPLQSSLLRRIRKSELLIMKESVQSRLRHAEESVQEAATLKLPRELRLPPEELHAEPSSSSSPPPAAAQLKQPVSCSSFIGSSGSRAFNLLPLGIEKTAVKSTFQEYIQRVPCKIASSTEQWKMLESALDDGGPLGLEWFWIQRQNAPSGSPSASTADGLAVFRLKKLSSSYGQLLHFTVLNMEHFQAALEVVKAVMFAYLPVRLIRFTLWYCLEEDGTYQLNKEAEAVLKKLCFRWFQLTNSGGVRGQVMQRPRGEPPEDPEQPVEVRCIELCVGQVWLRGSAAGRGASSVAELTSCSHSLALAATCLRSFWSKDSAEAPRPESLLDAHSIAAWAIAKDSLVQALLNGDLDRTLASLRPAKFELSEDSLCKAPANAGQSSSATLALSLAKTLEATSFSLPEVLCQAVSDAAELVRKGLSQEALREACSGLHIEGLPETVAAMKPKDGSFGRLVLALEWSSVTLVDDNTFEVPVHVAGTCLSHPHPVFYLATSEADVFAVIVPWHGMATVPKSDEAFAACTEILRAMTPMNDSPYSAVQLSGFEVRQAVHTREIADPVVLGLPGETVHVAEFSALSVSAGRKMPGRLSSCRKGSVRALPISRPFAMCIWHADMDEMNAPLSVTLVQ